MIDNTVYIISYKTNGKYNPILKDSKNRFKTQNFKIKVIEGYNLKDYPNMKRTEVVYKNFQKALMELNPKPNNDGFFISEDDSYLNDGITFEFLRDRIKAIRGYKSKVIRIGYQKVLKSGINQYVVGTQLIWIPQTKIKAIDTEMRNNRPQHLDGFLSKRREMDVILLDEREQMVNKNKYVAEIEHYSAILGKVRKGKKL